MKAHLFVRSVLSEIKLNCKFKCGEVVQHDQFEEHVEKCEENPENFVACESCGTKVSRKKLEGHQQNCLPFYKKINAELANTVKMQVSHLYNKIQYLYYKPYK